jgi:hypothetical protein
MGIRFCLLARSEGSESTNLRRMSTQDYNRQKLHSATLTLMTHPGDLPARVQAALTDLTVLGHAEEFQNGVEPIKTILRLVQNGDFSPVTDPQYQAVAHAVHDLMYAVETGPRP